EQGGIVVYGGHHVEQGELLPPSLLLAEPTTSAPTPPVVTRKQLSHGNFVHPTIIDWSEWQRAGIHSQRREFMPPLMYHERFLPILHVIPINSFAHAVEMTNAVPQGLSSSLFITNLSSAFTWIGPN